MENHYPLAIYGLGAHIGGISARKGEDVVAMLRRKSPAVPRWKIGLRVAALATVCVVRTGLRWTHISRRGKNLILTVFLNHLPSLISGLPKTSKFEPANVKR